ncbi:MAG: hypothetical protein KME50_14550 [Nostoc desertorum CM1-VF14]|jgi:hypothetical protein|nr:hypothetical protein [Nostoc desertorum CM1-VF14]
MKKILGLAILATFFATPAFAGETFVRNEWTDSHSKTYSDLNLHSTTHSTRNEDYSSWADKVYIDGGINTKGKNGVSFNDFTVHSAASELEGSFHESILSKIEGTIKTITETDTTAHETSAGVR